MPQGKLSLTCQKCEEVIIYRNTNFVSKGRSVEELDSLQKQMLLNILLEQIKPYLNVSLATIIHS